RRIRVNHEKANPVTLIEFGTSKNSINVTGFAFLWLISRRNRSYQQKQTHSRKNHERHLDAFLAVHFRHEIGGCYVQSRSCGDWQCVRHAASDEMNGEHAEQRRSAKRCRSGKRTL